MISSIFIIFITPTGCIRKRKKSEFKKHFKNFNLNCRDSSITVISPTGQRENANILGIDDCGYLKIKFSNNKIGSVTPDNNSFDLLKGLIVPKYQV